MLYNILMLFIYMSALLSRKSDCFMIIFTIFFFTHMCVLELLDDWKLTFLVNVYLIDSDQLCGYLVVFSFLSEPKLLNNYVFKGNSLNLMYSNIS